MSRSHSSTLFSGFHFRIFLVSKTGLCESGGVLWTIIYRDDSGDWLWLSSISHSIPVSSHLLWNKSLGLEYDKINSLPNSHHHSHSSITITLNCWYWNGNCLFSKKWQYRALYPELINGPVNPASECQFKSNRPHEH